MAPKRHRRMIDGPPFAAVLSLLLLLLLTARCAHAQPSPPSDSSSDNNYKNYGNLNPTLAIVIVVISSTFLFPVLFSIYIRSCNGENDFGWSFRPAGDGASRSRRQQQRGLSPEVLETFPTLMYAEVKELKEGKGALECAVCLSEFEDDEELRLIPRCNHVFHPDCINAWLASHVTCPVCRANLSEASATDGLDLSAVPNDAAGPQSETAAPAADHVAIVVDRAAVAAAKEGEWREEEIELVRIGSRRREARSRSGLRPAKFPRSHSTGHSVVRPVEVVDRYTLRLPEHVRMEIFAARKLHRSASCVAFPNSAEGSSRSGSREGCGQGSSRGVQSARLGKSDRWPSFLFRTLSMKFPAWAGGRRGNGEGSVRKGEGEGSTSGKIASGGGEDGSSAPSLPPQV